MRVAPITPRVRGRRKLISQKQNALTKAPSRTPMRNTATSSRPRGSMSPSIAASGGVKSTGSTVMK